MICFDYDRRQVQPGILHFGVGNFHRAHLEFYLNKLLASGEDLSWGVCGAMILPGDEALYKALKADDGMYELTVCSADGHRDVYRIGSLVGLEWGIENPEAIISKIASAQTKIITLTITEGGYKSDNASEGSVFWYVAKGLRLRMEAGLPITILSCDNLQHNGDTARRSFMSYFERECPDVAEWAKTNVTFPNSMVDRITPATKSGKITDVLCEDFIQWVVEDNFIAGRPQLEKVGVQFTSDVTPYENMKLSLLNASHTLLSYPSYLEGFKKVDAVLADSRYRNLLALFMDRDVTPYVEVAEGIDLTEYKATLLRRFSNAAISDQVSRLCGDGIAKFAVYVVPTLSKMLREGRDCRIEAFLLASYFKYLCLGHTEDGEIIDIFEPHITDKDKETIASGDPDAFLSLSPFESLKLESQPEFVSEYHQFIAESVAQGLDRILGIVEK